MVEHIVKVAGILSLPDLDAETKQVINAYIRDSIKGLSKEPARPQQELTPDILYEYLHGSRGGDSG